MQITHLMFIVLLVAGAQEAKSTNEENEPASKAEIEKAIRNLGSNSYSVRQNAQAKLLKFGAQAFEQLKEALKSKDQEVAARAKYVLSKIRLKDIKYAEVHVVGLYTGNNGKAIVEVSSHNRPIILVLCAYDPTHWEVLPKKGANIVRIILSGYHRQSLKGPDIPVTSRSYNEGSRNYFYSYRDKGKSFARLAAQLQAMTGKGITSFQGLYRPKTSFQIPAN